MQAHRSPTRVEREAVGQHPSVDGERLLNLVVDPPKWVTPVVRPDMDDAARQRRVEGDLVEAVHRSRVVDCFAERRAAVEDVAVVVVGQVVDDDSIDEVPLAETLKPQRVIDFVHGPIACRVAARQRGNEGSFVVAPDCVVRAVEHPVCIEVAGGRNG